MSDDSTVKPAEFDGNISLGEGRVLEPYGTCPDSPDGKHHHVAVSCVQSMEHFVCEFCPDAYYD